MAMMAMTTNSSMSVKATGVGAGNSDPVRL
jgi:hypothetical protein